MMLLVACCRAYPAEAMNMAWEMLTLKQTMALMLLLAIGLMTFVPFGIKKKPDNNARHKESMDGTGDKKK